MPTTCESSDEKWSLLEWARGIGTHRVVAAALQREMVSKGVQTDGDSAFRFLQSLAGCDRSVVRHSMGTAPVLEALTDLVWSAVVELQAAPGSKGATMDLQEKFSGLVELSFGGLDRFFRGLEGLIGPPSPRVHEEMADEHCDRGDSDQEFTTGNYGITTTSRLEWSFVTDLDGVPDASLARERWPDESPDKLPDRKRCRQPMPLATLVAAMEARNEQLRGANQPPLVEEEAIAARLYTGPVRPCHCSHPCTCRVIPMHGPFARVQDGETPTHVCAAPTPPGTHHTHRCSSSTTACSAACSRRATCCVARCCGCAALRRLQTRACPTRRRLSRHPPAASHLTRHADHSTRTRPPFMASSAPLSSPSAPLSTQEPRTCVTLRLVSRQLVDH